MLPNTEEGIVMSIPAHEGLCVRCSRAAACPILRESGEPVASCSAFEAAGGSRWEKAKEADAAHQRSFDRVAGLCIDCAYRSVCAFRHREGGVWHCEEYR
ncbi:MAG TPA: hypothetical protein PLO37_11555 [Candidatus Hydrogenedentes bacterium]|nr:hypothetical protein [Candidatus Hydrogenedentota bacterium]HPG67476.1 hypothetical protein [Candidatus Hydrogenedentota bacterium]